MIDQPSHFYGHVRRSIRIFVTNDHSIPLGVIFRLTPRKRNLSSTNTYKRELLFFNTGEIHSSLFTRYTVYVQVGRRAVRDPEEKKKILNGFGSACRWKTKLQTKNIHFARMEVE